MDMWAIENISLSVPCSYSGNLMCQGANPVHVVVAAGRASHSSVFCFCVKSHDTLRRRICLCTGRCGSAKLYPSEHGSTGKGTALPCAASCLLTSSKLCFHVLVEETHAPLLTNWVCHYFPHGQVEVVVVNQELLASVSNPVVTNNRPVALSSPINYARYFMPQLLPGIDKVHLPSTWNILTRHGQVAYMDADIIVLGDVVDLVTSSLQNGELVAFVPDPEATPSVLFLDKVRRRTPAIIG